MARKASREDKNLCSCLKAITVEPLAFCYMIGSYLQYTAFLSLTYEKSCLKQFNGSFCEALENKTYQKEHKDEQDDVQAEASFWLMLSNLVVAFPAIFSVFLFMGPWGDKVDRKLPLMIPCAGAFMYNVLNVLNAHFEAWPILALFPGLAVDAVSGGYITILMASYSYITHISPQQDRTVRVGIVGAMIYFAGTISVFVSGLLVEALGHVKVFGIVCAFNGVAFLYGLLFLESVIPEGKEERKGKSWWNTYIVSTLSETWEFVRKPREGNQRLLMWLEILTLNIVHMCTSGETDILYLYLKRSPRSFTRTQYGYFKGTENFSRSLTLLTLLPLLKKKLYVRDTTIVLIGLVFRAATLLMLALADNLLLVFLAAIPALFQGFPSSGLRASMSGRVSVNEHGRLFAVVAALESCVSMATGFIFNGWYPSTLAYFDGTCFVFAAGMCILATVIMFYVHIHSRSHVQKDLSDPSGGNYTDSCDSELSKEKVLINSIGEEHISLQNGETSDKHTEGVVESADGASGGTIDKSSGDVLCVKARWVKTLVNDGIYNVKL